MENKGLKVASVVLLVFGVFGLLVCAAAAWGGGRFLEEGTLSMSRSDFIGSMLLSLLGVGLQLAAGVLGLRLVRCGRGRAACKTTGAGLLIFQIGSAILNLLGGDRSAESVASMALCILLTVYYLVGGCRVGRDGVLARRRKLDDGHRRGGNGG